MQPEPAYVEDILNLAGGAITIRTPMHMTAEDVEDLGDFFELILRAAKRAASPTAPGAL